MSSKTSFLNLSILSSNPLISSAFISDPDIDFSNVDSEGSCDPPNSDVHSMLDPCPTDFASSADFCNSDPVTDFPNIGSEGPCRNSTGSLNIDSFGFSDSCPG